MKTSVFLLLLMLALGACENKERDDSGNPEVDEFISLLRAGEYESMYLPAFTWQDIPALLHYRNECEPITDFPRNPLSSFYGPECRLGVYVLWTIESIRLAAIPERHLTFGFPSLNPMLGLSDFSSFERVDADRAHKAAARSYSEWFGKTPYMDFDVLKYTDPLYNTGYCWR